MTPPSLCSLSKGAPSRGEVEIQSRFLLDLYRGISQHDAAQFQDWALERLSQDLPFDSALWASTSATIHGPIGHTAHPYRQPMQMLVDYESIKHLDTLVEESRRSPGRTIRIVSRDSLPPAAHAYLGRYGLEQTLTTLDHELQMAAYAVISLYRASRDRPFSEAEANLKQSLFPHLVEANRLAHRSRHRQQGPSTHWRSAVGRVSPSGDMTPVQPRERHAIDGLPERMRQVARLAAAGNSNKRIAAMLDISPNTVRNHLVEAYERLAVKNKAEMAGLLLRFEDDFTGDGGG